MDRKPSLELLDKKLTLDEHCESRSLSDRSIAAVDSSSTASPSSTSTSAENVGVITMPDKVPRLAICLAVCLAACLAAYLWALWATMASGRNRVNDYSIF